MTVHNEFLKWLADQLAATTVKLVLVNNTHTPNKDTQRFYSDILSKEISGTGYTAGGKTVTGITVTKDDATDKAVISCADVVWFNSSLTAGGEAFIIWTGNAATSPIIGSRNYGQNYTSTNGNYTAQAPAALLDLTEIVA